MYVFDRDDSPPTFRLQEKGTAPKERLQSPHPTRGGDRASFLILLL